MQQKYASANTGTQITDLSALKRMSEAACGMVARSVDAFVQRDLALAEAVVRDDDIVDAQFCAVRATLVELIRKDGLFVPKDLQCLNPEALK